MGVTFRGGTSGNREDALPPVPSSGTAQPVLDTSTSGATPSTVNFQAENFNNKSNIEQATPDFLPTGGTVPDSGTDIEDPTATTGGWGPGVQTSKSDYSGPGR